MNNQIEMERITQKVVKQVKSKEILLLGFRDDFRILLYEFQNSSIYSFHIINTLEDVGEWLSSSTKSRPYAMICNYAFLESHDFAVLKTIKKDELLVDVPFVTISHAPITIGTRMALQIGIDDHFVEPVDWKVIHHRLAFLNRFKKLKRPIQPSNGQVIQAVEISFVKRLFDIVFASGVLLVCSPILLLVAIVIKLESKGPVLFVSKRIGTNYRPFDFYKFRTMKVNNGLEGLTNGNIYSSDDTCFHKFKNDPRITRFGRILRKTSLDEIPQLFNVLMGHMSIVGNRPLPTYEARKLTTDEYALRFFAPAGITGLWQVAPEGKENVSQEKRINLDLEYAQKHSFVMDLRIMASTLPAMLQKGE